jgi:NAD(P)H-quinone oxidoreductase subunit 5
MSVAVPKTVSVSEAEYRRVKKCSQARARLPEQGFLLLLIAAVIYSAGALAEQSLFPQPFSFWGVTIDRLSGLLTFLVAMVGMVTFRFSQRYLDGEPGQVLFLRWLFITVCAAYLFMLSTNLWLLFSAWLVVSLGLHQLLIYYRDRPEALRPARKKFLISRIGDVFLLSAVCIIGQHWGTWDVRTFLVLSAHESSLAVTLVALLIVAAALTKSAQFPFHSWLPETMEAPTPVSALMHAGIINAGGVLLLRFAPLLTRVPSALFLLTLVGTATVCLGLLVMWAQPNFKRTLAWSTVGQMGFMMVEFGMVAFSAAVLHIVGHGFYKAWSFLRAGDLPSPSGPMTVLSPRVTVSLFALGTAAGLASVLWTARWTGFQPLAAPGLLGLSVILALSLGQVWVACFRSVPSGSLPLARGAATAVGASLLLAVAAGALYRGAELFFAPVFGVLPISHSPWAWASALLPGAVLAGLCLLHPYLPSLMRTRSGRAFHVHALHGFYFSPVADRFVEKVWVGVGRLTIGLGAK